MASSSSSSPLEDLETQLEMFVENVRQIRIIVADFQPQGQTVLNQKIQNAVTGLQEINKLKSNVQDIHVPLEVFEYIDRGRNPQLYTKDCIEKALHKNEQVKGKIDAFKKFKANVLTDLGQTFPNELNKYRALRSNCYGTNNVVPPPPPPMNILSSGTPLSGSNNSQQSQLVGSCLSVQQINNASTVVSGVSSCLSNSQQQPNATNISLLGCDGVSTVSAGNNSNNIGGPTVQQNRITVNRRLQFDDEIIVTPVKKRHIVDNNSRPKEIILPNHADSLFFDDEMQQKGILNKTPNLHISTSIEKDIILLKEKKRVQAIVESLLVRGFSVQKLPKELVNSYKPVNETNDEGSLVFECMSLIEGFVYSVHVIDTALQDKVDAVRVAARTLATVGPHPHIISYFSNWTDGRFHYVQMELYHDHLLLPNSEQRFDCHTILEHVSCALHYLHDYKNYAHNLVNRWNIYRITDSGSDSVVYKLAGFHRATKLTTVDNDKSVVNTDVKSLCSTVLELLEEQRGDGYSVADDNVEQELWSYLLSIMDRIDLVVGVIDGGLSSSSQMDVNALNVWRWCYNFRRQHIQRPCPTGLMTGIVYRDSHQ